MKKYLLSIAIFLGCVGCTEDKVNSPSEQKIPEPPKKEEVIKVIELIKRIYADFGFNDVKIELSTRPENSIGSDEIWEVAENALKGALEALKIDYVLNPGDGAFYGPKIDFHVKDAIGRSWQCGTIQLDFQLPEKF